uniref:Beta-lactamase-related domain-containing protein n=1 Tax=Panagrolaimus superbus TaxID=310955 RepID=A0A914ZC62_9BILA
MVSLIKSIFYTTPEIINVEGFVAPGYEGIKDVFEKNFINGWEPEGSSLAIYHKGKLVVDIWGGYADKECRRLWKSDTITITFSSTKAMAALCIALLIDRGLLSYEDKIVKFWPEFGKNGKDLITVQWILSHLSGLAYFDQEITEEDARDWKRMAKIIENESPKWEAGTAAGYHAITYGWLADQIVRRVDPKKRSLAQFFGDEIQNGADYHIGLDPSQSHRVARLKCPTVSQRISEFFTNPKAINYFQVLHDFATNGIFTKIEANPTWFKFFKHEITLNNPDLYTLEHPGVMGIGNGKSMAEIFHRAIFEKKLFKNPETLLKFASPYIDVKDKVVGMSNTRGQGLFHKQFFHKKSRTLCKSFGHCGFGGQMIKVDLENELCFGYVSNGLKCGLSDNIRTFASIQKAIYDCILIRDK